ncbi:hypothetical protein K1719_007137 [Acacia pycnantha]|nr:hypothetical protein K1719_007137 [Acacia pycnantha]
MLFFSFGSAASPINTGVHNVHSASSSTSGPPSFSPNMSNHQSYPRLASLMERRGDEILSAPHSLRALVVDIEGRRRLISEIRQVLSAMRRGENLRAEAWRSMLETPHQAQHKPQSFALQHVPASQHDHPRHRRPGPTNRPPQDSRPFRDFFEEISKYGDIESLNICDNLADHMVGNVYVQFREEEHAANALKSQLSNLLPLILSVILSVIIKFCFDFLV